MCKVPAKACSKCGESKPLSSFSKACSKCGESKPLSSFSKAATGKDGVRGDCKDCRRLYCIKWYEGLSPGSKKTRQGRPGKKAYMAKYSRDNKDRLSAQKKVWAAQNKDLVRSSMRAAMRRYRSTPRGRLNSIISRAVNKSLKQGGKAGRKTFDLLGFSTEELRRHLESQFVEGMSWENYGEWHIDHIIPLSAHNFDSHEHADFKRAWALANLRPLWASENLKKGAKLDAPFQPSLAI